MKKKTSSVKEGKARASKPAKKSAKTLSGKKTRVKKNDADAVADYMKALKHPLKKEMEAVRAIIKDANSKIMERIKWNAPSYYYQQDIVTFNHRTPLHVHLVFHHPYIVQIKSSLLEGDYKDRRMTYFKDMKSVNENKSELQRIMNELIKMIDNTKK